MIFPTGLESRNRVLYDLIVFDEIRTIERAIIVATQDDLLELTVDFTPMTDPSSIDAIEYWKVWQNIVENRLYRLRMEKVKNYFLDKRFSIVQKTNEATEETFIWEIKW